MNAKTGKHFKVVVLVSIIKTKDTTTKIPPTLFSGAKGKVVFGGWAKESEMRL